MKPSRNKEKPSKQKQQPMLLPALFRHAVEKQVKEFISSNQESFEFPVFLTQEQRDFISEYSYKQGLKSKCSGKGKIHTKHQSFRSFSSSQAQT
jgi:hypothetical protein